MINLSIFAHISLDSESDYHYGLSGNTFENTFKYLQDYLKQLEKDPAYTRRLSESNFQKLREILQLMEQLVKREKEILKINSILTSSDDFKRYMSTLTRELSQLPTGADFMLPGGWQNKSGGHGMIYQFHRTQKDTLIFSIYNSGAGLSHHDVISFKKTERYFPIKSFEIPANASEAELHILLNRLILPNLPKHPDRNNIDFNAAELYQSIEYSLPFLKAHIVPLTLDPKHATTAGQISGTCAQRSIHQMLKLNFDTLPTYRRFIFDFKLYALRDLLNTHPAPRAEGIARLIVLAIEHNLKLLAKKGVFDDSREKETAAQELILLKSVVLEPGAIKPDRTDLTPIKYSTIPYSLNPSATT